MPETQRDETCIAERALAEADAKTLKQLFDKKCEELDLLVRGMAVMVDNKKALPRQDDQAFAAMRDVTLAAIDLAKSVATST